jgi:hypothetical protein
LQVANAFKPQPAYRTWGAVPRKAPLLSLGIGGSLELDRGGLTPAMRVRFQDWLTVKVGGAPCCCVTSTGPGVWCGQRH